MADLADFDPLKDPDVADCVRQVYNEGVRLKQQITGLLDSTQTLGYLEEHHSISADYFNGLLETYRELLDAHSRRYVAPEESIDFNDWVNRFTFPILHNGAIYRRQFLAYLFNQRDSHLMSIVSVVLHESQFLKDDFWINTGWGKVKEEILKVFVDKVSPYPKLGKDACHYFPNTSKQARSGRCPHGYGAENHFCYNLALQRWETWHELNSNASKD